MRTHDSKRPIARQMLTCLSLAALLLVLGTSVASAGTIDDLAPAGDGSEPGGGDATVLQVDRPLGAGVRVQLTQWIYRGVILATQQIWYVDLDESGDFSRGDRVMNIRRS